RKSVGTAFFAGLSHISCEVWISGILIEKTIKTGEYIFNNNTDTVVEFDVNTCKTKQHPKQCEETIIALAHHHKKITLAGVTGGTIKVIARDKRNRFKKSLIINTANSLQKSTTG
ncbi:MAG: hypothetical protein OXD32_06790, partial [Endozoicomonadaceae bacterium]|nr:hypothetical protein [Endozoicomonadaceae bacterium]